MGAGEVAGVVPAGVADPAVPEGWVQPAARSRMTMANRAIAVILMVFIPTGCPVHNKKYPCSGNVSLLLYQNYLETMTKIHN
jgi:hypothetical protein